MDPDPMEKLFEVRDEIADNIRAIKSEALDHIEPRKTKDGWIVGLADFDEVAARLEASEARRLELEGDISTATAICGGSELRPLTTERNGSRGRIQRAIGTTEAARRKAEIKHRGASLSELANDPGVIEAEKALEVAKAEESQRIEELSLKISEVMEIIEKWS